MNSGQLVVIQIQFLSVMSSHERHWARCFSIPMLYKTIVVINVKPEKGSGCDIRDRSSQQAYCGQVLTVSESFTFNRCNVNIVEVQALKTRKITFLKNYNTCTQDRFVGLLKENSCDLRHFPH